jgi:hypothetical protein
VLGPYGMPAYPAFPGALPQVPPGQQSYDESSSPNQAPAQYDYGFPGGDSD